MKRFVLAIMAVPAICFAFPNCQEGDAIPVVRKAEAVAIGAGWMKNAVHCDLGRYQIIVPKDEGSTEILILKNGKPFMMHQEGFGINLYQNCGESGAIPYVTVQDRDDDGIFERLDYSLVDKKGNVIGNVRDMAMDGKPKVIRYGK